LEEKKKSIVFQRRPNVDDEAELKRKKLQTLPVRNMVKSEDKRYLDELDERIKKFEKKWENACTIDENFEKGVLEVTAVSDKISGSRSQFNKTIMDDSIQNIMKELLEAIKVQGYDSRNIDNLKLDLKKCNYLSKLGLAHVFKTINNEFKNVRTLDLDFSLKIWSQFPRSTSILSEITLNLPYLEELTLNFYGRVDFRYEEIIQIFAGLRKSSENSLDTLNLILPRDLLKEKLVDIIKTELAYVKNLTVSQAAYWD